MNILHKATNKFARQAVVWMKTKDNFQQHITAVALCLLVGLIIVFILTNPNTIGPVGILTTLLLLFLLFTSIILLFRNRSAGKFTTIDHKRKLIIRSALDATPLIVLVGLNTLRQITLGDLLIVPILYLAVKFYAHRQLGL